MVEMRCLARKHIIFRVIEQIPLLSLTQLSDYIIECRINLSDKTEKGLLLTNLSLH